MECAKTCQSLTDCDHWTWSIGDNNCQSFTETDEYVEKDPTMLSGPRSCINECLCNCNPTTPTPTTPKPLPSLVRCVQYGKSYNESLPIDILQNMNHWSECAKACNDMSESYLCKYWTWTPVKKECLLHHGNAQAVHALAISGPVDCTTEWVNCC